jgi:hypothetical protein
MMNPPAPGVPGGAPPGLDGAPPAGGNAVAAAVVAAAAANQRVGQQVVAHPHRDW